MKILINFLLLAVLFLASGCVFRSVPEEELLGKYKAIYPDGSVEWLEVRPNGECYQEIQIKNGPIYKATGKWRYWLYKSSKTHRNRARLSLEGTRDPFEPDGLISPTIADIPTGFRGLSISRTFSGKVKIGFSEYCSLIKQ